MLKIETEKLENHQVKLIVETDSAQFEDAKQRAARSLARKTKIPGFRPGKAPYAMILRHLGENQIIEEALDQYVHDIYPKAIEEAKIEPYGPGELNNVIGFNPPKFEFKITLKPTVELGDYRSIKIPYSLKEITEDEVNEVLQNLRDRQAILAPISRPANEGDVVFITIIGKRDSPSGEANNIIVSERTVPILILNHSDDQNEWPFPGFSCQLIGLSEGDNKSIPYIFPEEFYVDELKGAHVIYDIKVTELKSRTLPELNDEFAQSLGDYQDIFALNNAIRHELEDNQLSTYNREYDDQLLDEIIKVSTINYPVQALEKEKSALLEQFKDRLEKQKQDINLYLKSRNITIENLMEELSPVAETRLKKSLVIFELAKAEGIEIKPEELQKETDKTLEQLTPLISKSKLSKRTEKEVASNIMGNVMLDLMVNHTMERLRGIARGTEILAPSDSNSESTELQGELTTAKNEE